MNTNNEESRNVKLLAFCRPMSAKSSIRQITMTPDEVLERRTYIRKVLNGSKLQDLTDDEIDNIRLEQRQDGSILYEDAQGYESYIRAAGMTEDETRFRKSRTMIPFDFMELKGKDFDWNIYGKDISEPKSYINNFILKFPQFQRNGMGLYIYSSMKGSGKTMLSCCIINELVERYPVAVKFINALDLLEMTKESFKGQEPEELKALYAVAVLVIDDIGVQMSKEWIDTVFYRLINARYSNRLVTIYTSNLMTGMLKMDDRIVDRIESTTYLVELPNVPVRSMKRDQEKEKIMELIKTAP